MYSIHPEDIDQHEEVEVEPTCECGAVLESEDEVFSEECSDCFAEAILEDPEEETIN